MGCESHARILPTAVVLTVVVVVATCAAAVSINGGGKLRAHARVALHRVRDGTADAELRVAARVGTSAPIPFVLDTGASGAPSVAADVAAHCDAYTGGCLSKTSTIASGSVGERAQLYKCGCLQLRVEGGAFVCVRRRQADVLLGVSTGENLLTLDYMRQVGPSVLWMKQGVWEICRGVRAAWLRTAMGAHRARSLVARRFWVP